MAEQDLHQEIKILKSEVSMWKGLAKWMVFCNILLIITIGIEIYFKGWFH